MSSYNSYNGPFKFDNDDEGDRLEVEEDDASWSSSISNEEKEEHIESSVTSSSFLTIQLMLFFPSMILF